jgi:hypothetical protein
MPTSLAPIAWFPIKGLDLISAPHDVGMEFAQDGFDVYVKNSKDLLKRPGYENQSSLSADISWLGSLALSNGNRFELAGAEGNIYNGSAVVISGRNTGDMNYTQFLDTGIWADGNATLCTWNGTASGVINPGNFTIACAEHLNKLFTADVSASTVRYSQTGSISAFTGVGTDVFNFEQNNGQTITALHSFARNELLIFKDRSMGKLVGYDKPSFNLITVDKSVGCINKKTVQNYKSNTTGGLCVFCGQDGVYVYDGSVPRKVSEYVQEFWDNIPRDRFTQLDSTIDTARGLYILSCPNGFGQTTNNRLLVMDMLNPWQDETGMHFPFWIWRVEADAVHERVSTSNTPSLTFAQGTEINTFSNTALDDGGDSINAYVVTPSMTGDGIVGTDACLRRAYVTMSSASGNMSVFGEIKDGEDWELQDNIDMSGGAARLGIDFALGTSPLGFLEANFSARVNMSLRSRRVKIKFEQDSGSFRFTLNRPVEFYFKAGGTRG